MPKVRLNNWAREVNRRAGRDYFQWRVFVDEPPEIIQRIADVEYRLHPTFPQPVQVRRDRTTLFALDSQGWGEFTIEATVHFVDGREETVGYWLDFGKQWPKDVPPPPVGRTFA